VSLVYDGGKFWYRDDERGGPQQPVDESAEQDLATLVDLFRIRFGRDPGSGDPLIFDPRCDEPTPLPRHDLKAAIADLLRDLQAHPAYQWAFQKLGYLITVENARYARPEDIARWGEAIAGWQLANPDAPPLLSLVIDSGRERTRCGPEYAAVQEALAHADRASTEQEKLVVGIVCARHRDKPGKGRRLTVLYYPDFVRVVEQAGNGACLDGEYVLEGVEPRAFETYLERGWVPVSVAFGDDGSDAQFVPVQAGLALTAIEHGDAAREGMEHISALLERFRQ